MKRILCCFLGFSTLLLAKNLKAELWPFDQRQVVLMQIQGSNFPDAITTAQILDVFVERARIRWITQKAGAGDLSPILVPSDFLWNRSDSVRSLGLRYKADGIVVLSEKDSRIDLRWYAVSDGQPLYFESLYLPSSSGTEAQDTIRKQRLRSWLLDMWKRIPGQGYVVKRDIENLEIEGALNEGLKVGDRISLLRLKEVKRHPVLKTLMGFDSAETGYAIVTDLGRPFSTAKVEYESELDPIQAGDRYLFNRSATLKPLEAPAEPSVVENQVPQDMFFGGGKIFDLVPRLGLGFLSYEERTADDLFQMKTFSFSYGIEARLRLTGAWYAGMRWDAGGASFSSPPEKYLSSSLGSGWSNTRFTTGYKMSLGSHVGLSGMELDFFGGYSRFKVRFEEKSSTVAPASKNYSGLDVGMAMSMPLQERWLAQFGFSRALGAFLKEELLTSGASSSNTLWNFWTKLRILPTDRAEFGGGYEVLQGSSTFEGAGTRATSALSAKVSSQRTFVYYQYTF
jgi:hypothetical protein